MRPRGSAHKTRGAAATQARARENRRETAPAQTAAAPSTAPPRASPPRRRAAHVAKRPPLTRQKSTSISSRTTARAPRPRPPGRGKQASLSRAGTRAVSRVTRRPRQRGLSGRASTRLTVRRRSLWAKSLSAFFSARLAWPVPPRLASEPRYRAAQIARCGPGGRGLDPFTPHAAVRARRPRGRAQSGWRTAVLHRARVGELARAPRQAARRFRGGSGVRAGTAAFLLTRPGPSGWPRARVRHLRSGRPAGCRIACPPTTGSK